jgi:hypothetical protein
VPVAPLHAANIATLATASMEIAVARNSRDDLNIEYWLAVNIGYLLSPKFRPSNQEPAYLNNYGIQANQKYSQ